MAHSPSYFAAAGAADRGFGWIHASAGKIADPVIHGLIDKVRLVVERTGNEDRYRQGATVTIRTKDGRLFSSTVFEPKGSGAPGLSWNDLDAKYRTLMPASGLGASAIEDSLVLIHDFRNLGELSTLTRLLHVTSL